MHRHFTVKDYLKNGKTQVQCLVRWEEFAVYWPVTEQQCLNSVYRSSTAWRRSLGSYFCVGCLSPNSLILSWKMNNGTDREKERERERLKQTRMNAWAGVFGWCVRTMTAHFPNGWKWHQSTSVYKLRRNSSESPSVSAAVAPQPQLHSAERESILKHSQINY